MEISINNIKEINQAAQKFLSATKQYKVFAFYGSMGVGKTTFIKELCLELGVEDNANSPTFAIINEYLTTDKEVIYHFDFYRIRNIAEALDIGSEDYFYSNNYCFIEWPEKIEAILPEETLNVYLSENIDGSRIIKF